LWNGVEVVVKEDADAPKIGGDLVKNVSDCGAKF